MAPVGRGAHFAPMFSARSLALRRQPATMHASSMHRVLLADLCLVLAACSTTCPRAGDALLGQPLPAMRAQPETDP